MGTGLCSKCHLALTEENSFLSIFLKQAGYCRVCSKTRVGTGRCWDCKVVFDENNSCPSTLVIGRGMCRLCETKEYETKAVEVKERAAKWAKDNRGKRLAIQRKSNIKCWRSSSEEYKKSTTKKNTANYRKQKFGITTDEFEAKLKSQNNCCAICKKPLISGKWTMRTPCLDHNHETNKVRDILCGACNFLLGYCYEDEKILAEAISYLRKHNGDSSIQIARVG
jgi:hypothetical protein